MAEITHPLSYDGVTAMEAVRIMARALSAAGIDSPAADARLLVPAALGLTKSDLIVHPQRPLTREEASRLEQFQLRRCGYEPVSRILGEREFFGRMFEITPDTLDPRPDSETLIEAALELVRERAPQDSPVRILDIGTGTGCLLLTLLAELPGAAGVGTDLSAAALSVAAHNAMRHGLSGRVRWSQLRSLNGLCDPFDLIISNPPYIPSSDLETLEPEVRLFDPALALDGGVDGLQIYREIAGGLALAPAFAAALFEVGAGQAADVEDILRAQLGPKVHRVRSWIDLGGHTRCVAVVTQ